MASTITTPGSTGRDTSERDALLEQLKAEFEQRLAALASQPQQWAEFLDQVAVFAARYSMGNQLMLMMQCQRRGITPRYFLPCGAKDASSGWRAHGRHINRGEKAFYVWAPVRRRPSQTQAAQWEAAGRTVLRDPDGRPAVQLAGFRPSATFELSQTSGEPFEAPTVMRRRRAMTAAGQIPQLLTGDGPAGVSDEVAALIESAGYHFELAPPGSGYLGNANGVTVHSAQQRLVKVRDDTAPAQRLKTSVHELAHIRCGHPAAVSAGQTLHRGRGETEAESIAHIVCAALGLDTRTYSDAYVLSWAEGDLALIQACGETVIKIARSILDDLTAADDTSSGHPGPAPGVDVNPAAARDV
jgi:hypothetical protein